ncbi:MAG TPA: hypothetical protein VJN72_12790 [Gaiellales bacterium]|nr:hypothetical protein [Gaiellales bacterium]
MLRRTTIALALAGLAIAAPPALAKHHAQWHSQMQDASRTASQAADGCRIQPGWHHSLLVACDSSHTATFVYVFSAGHGKGRGSVQGTPTSGVAWWGRHGTDVHSSVKASGGTLRQTVTVTDGFAQLFTVNVGYYA